jgi:hypothetical protein
LYVAADTNDSYRWDGTKYVRISERVLSTGIQDSSVVGRKVLTAVDEKAGRAALVAERHRTFNVKDYGAVGDGVADDRAAIHAARDAAGVGGRLFFPKGTYKVVGLSSGAAGYKFGAGGLWANVEGQTWLLDQATLVYTGGNRENLITVSAPNVTVVGGTLDVSANPPDVVNESASNNGIAVWSGVVTGNGVTYGPHGSGAAGAVIDGVTVKDAPFYGIFVLNTNSVTVKNCLVKDFFVAGIIVQNNKDSADKPDVHDFLIDGNRLESKWASFAAPLYIGANDMSAADFTAGTSRVTHARITNNSCVIPTSIYPGQGSFYDEGAEAGAIQLSNIEDSVLDGNTTEGGAFGITCAYMRRVVISNNTCRRFRGCGIETSGGHESVVVSGNTLDMDGAGGPYNVDTGLQDPAGTLNPTGTGILSNCNSPVRNYTITGNTVTGFTTTARVSAVLLAGNGSFQNVTVSGNTITAGSTTGGQFFGVQSAAATTNLTVSGNTFDGGGADRLSLAVGLNGKTQTGVSVTGNNISNMGRAAFEASKLTDGVFTDFHYRGNSARNCFMVLRGDLVTPGGVTRFFHDVGLVKDANANTSVEFAPVASAVNYLQFRNSPTLGDVAVRAMGTDTDISVNMWPKGAGVVKANGTQVEVKGHTHTVAQVTGAAQWVAVPATATSTGTAGQLAADPAGTFLYCCVATNVWRRVALTAW